MEQVSNQISNQKLETTPVKPDRLGREYTPEEAKDIEKIVGRQIDLLWEKLRLAQQLKLQAQVERIQDQISHAYEEAETLLSSEKWEKPLGYLFEKATLGTSDDVSKEGLVGINDLETRENLINFWKFIETKFGKNGRATIIPREELVAELGIERKQAEIMSKKDLVLMPGTDYVFYIDYEKGVIGLTRHSRLAEVIRKRP